MHLVRKMRRVSSGSHAETMRHRRRKGLVSDMAAGHLTSPYCTKHRHMEFGSKQLLIPDYTKKKEKKDAKSLLQLGVHTKHNDGIASHPIIRRANELADVLFQYITDSDIVNHHTIMTAQLVSHQLHLSGQYKIYLKYRFRHATSSTNDLSRNPGIKFR